MKNELEISGERLEVEVVFTEKVMTDIMSKLQEEADNFIGDATTAAGRKNIISFARKFSSTKTLIDNAGKQHVAELKKLPGKIDAERKRLREKCDELRDKVRKPVTEWENARKAIDESIGRIKVFITYHAANSCLIDADIKKLIDIDYSVIVEDKLEEYVKAIEDALAAQYLFFSIVAQEEIDKMELDRLKKEEEDRVAKEKKDEEIKRAEEAATKKANDEAAKKILQAQLDKEKAEKKLLEAKESINETVAIAVKKAVSEKTEVPVITEVHQEPLPIKKPEVEVNYSSFQSSSPEKNNIERIKVQIRKAIQAEGSNFGQAQVLMEAIVSGRIPNVKVTY